MRGFVGALALVGMLSVAGGAAAADAATPDPAMAPLAQYLMTDRAAEIALARSAAPASVSDGAEVMALGPKGFETAAAGTNGFVCLVQRSWFAGLDDAEFWNPRVRSPICFNRQGARSVLPTYLKRTGWALEGVSREAMVERVRADLAAGRMPPPETGTLTYMMSKLGYNGDNVGGPWRPHLMFFLPRMAVADWGANRAGSPVMGADGGLDPYTIFFVPLAAWSDGTPAGSEAAHHGM